MDFDEITSLAQQVGKLLINKGWSITTAESCTGGGIAFALTEVAGSSAYVNQCYVTYSNDAKEQLVGVKNETLVQYGAVSQTVVEEMATGALKSAAANCAIAVSGIAGPGGGTEEKPVGTVWLAIAIQPKSTDVSTVYTECFTFAGDRNNARLETIKSSFIRVLDLLND